MSRDHDFEAMMRETYIGRGQLGLMKIARNEREKVMELKRLLESIDKWMDDAELGSDGTVLALQVSKALEGLKDSHGDD